MIGLAVEVLTSQGNDAVRSHSVSDELGERWYAVSGEGIRSKDNLEHLWEVRDPMFGLVALPQL